MKKTDPIPLVTYPPKVEKLNFLTHLAAAAASVPAGAMMIRRAARSGDKVRILSAALFSGAAAAVYSASSLYHGLRPGRAKAAARVLDHMAVPLLIGGTAAPCSLVTLREVSPARGRFVFFTSQAIVLAGAASKLFFFNNKILKAAVYALYIGGGAAMLAQSIPVRHAVTKEGVRMLWAGCLSYLTGAAFFRLGEDRPSMHVVFHVLCALGTALHGAAIYRYVMGRSKGLENEEISDNQASAMRQRRHID